MAVGGLWPKQFFDDLILFSFGADMVQGYPIGQFNSSDFIGSSEAWPDPQLAERIQTVVSERLSPAHAAMLATSASSGGSQDQQWFTSLSGLPQQVGDLDAEAQGSLHRLAAERLRDIRQLSQTIAQDDPQNADLAPHLERAGHYTSDDALYSVDGEPVLVYWGHGEQTGEAYLAAEPLDGAPPPPPPPPQMPGGAGREPWYRRIPAWVWWLIGGVLVLLLILMLLWLFWPKGGMDSVMNSAPQQATDPVEPAPQPAPDQPEPPAQDPPQPDPQLSEPPQAMPQPQAALPTHPDTVTPPAAPATVQPLTPEQRLELRAARTRQEHLLSQIDLLERQLAAALNSCQVPTVQKPMAAPELKPDPVPEPPVQQVPEPPVQQVPEPAQPQPQPQEQAALEPCPQEREPWEAPEVVMVMDVSGSMDLPVGIDPQHAQDLLNRAQAGDKAAILEMTSLFLQPGDKRIDRAKSAVSEVVTNLPDDVHAGLVVIGSCDGAISHRFYAPNERGEMLGLIDGLQTQEGTPLARGLERAGNMIAPSAPEGVIVVVTDGHDSCGGDPCAVAASLAQSRPNVRVNVVDIGDAGMGQCIADATGGKVMVVNRLDELNDTVRQAAEQDLPAHCK